MMPAHPRHCCDSPAEGPESAWNPLSWASMSLIRLLSFVPFVRRHVPSTRDLDDEAASDLTLLFRALNLLAVVWGLMLLVSVAAFLVFALRTPGVAFFSSPGARDAEIQSINSVTDIGLLQRKAVLDVSEGYATGATATALCHIALGTLLFMIMGSIAGLLLIRWMKRHLSPAEDDTDAAPEPFER